MAFSNGVVDVYGDVTNTGGGRITVSGGGVVNFYDDVTLLDGGADVHATALGSVASRVVFFGEYNGGVTGGGQAFIEGDHRPGASPGLVRFDGDVAYGFLSTLEVEIGGAAKGTEFDSVAAAGAAGLSGSLDVVLLDGFAPTLGDAFEVLTAAGGLSGEFDLRSLPDLGPLLEIEAVYTPSSVTLVVAPALTGDYNADGVVDAADYTVYRDSLGQAGPGLPADGDADGTVDPDDYQLWANNYGASVAALTQTVPEPTATCLALAALAGGLRRSRRVD